MKPEYPDLAALYALRHDPEFFTKIEESSLLEKPLNEKQKEIIQKLIEASEKKNLPLHQQEALFLAALLLEESGFFLPQDSSQKTVAKTDKIANKIRKRLWKKGFFNRKRDLRESAIRLAVFADLPNWLLEREDKERILSEILADEKLISLFDEELLYTFLEALDPEDGAWKQKLQQMKAIPFRMPVKDTEGTEVIMLSGLPASGKDTFIANHLKGLPVVSLDDIRLEKNISPVGDQSRVVAIAKERAVDLLKKKQPFVWNATSLNKRLRKEQYDLFKKFGGKVKIVYLETDFDNLLERNEKREATVPMDAIERMLSIIDPPHFYEGDEVEWVYS